MSINREGNYSWNLQLTVFNLTGNTISDSSYTVTTADSKSPVRQGICQNTWIYLSSGSTLKEWRSECETFLMTKSALVSAVIGDLINLRISVLLEVKETFFLHSHTLTDLLVDRFTAFTKCNDTRAHLQTMNRKWSFQLCLKELPIFFLFIILFIGKCSNTFIIKRSVSKL